MPAATNIDHPRPVTGKVVVVTRASQPAELFGARVLFQANQGVSAHPAHIHPRTKSYEGMGRSEFRYWFVNLECPNSHALIVSGKPMDFKADSVRTNLGGLARARGRRYHARMKSLDKNKCHH